MSRRNRVIPIRVKHHPIGDKSKLLWERYWAPMQGAAQALNAAIANTQNLLGGIIIEMEGFSPETHVFDMDNMRIVERPKSPLAREAEPNAE